MSDPKTLNSLYQAVLSEVPNTFTNPKTFYKSALTRLQQLAPDSLFDCIGDVVQMLDHLVEWGFVESHLIKTYRGANKVLAGGRNEYRLKAI